MLKKPIILILFSLIYTSAFGQYLFNDNYQMDIFGHFLSDAKMMNIKGKIKTVTEYNYNASGELDSIVKGSIDSYNIGRSFRFDKHGNITELLFFKDSTDITKVSDTREKIFVYDEKGNVTEMQEVGESYPKKYVYTYDNEGRIEEISIFKENGDLSVRESFKYDRKKGYLISRKRKTSYTYKYNYDYNKLSNANLKATRSYGSNDEEYTVYGSEGRKTEYKKLRTNRRKYSQTYSYKYDSHNNLTEENFLSTKISFSGGSSNYHHKYKIEYLPDGNWSVKTTFDVDPQRHRWINGKLVYVGDTPNMITERTFEFYE